MMLKHNVPSAYWRRVKEDGALHLGSVCGGLTENPGGGRGEGQWRRTTTWSTPRPLEDAAKAKDAAKDAFQAEHAARKKNVRHHPIVTITTDLFKILKADAEDDDPRISATEKERRRMLMRDRIANIPTGKKRKAEEAGFCSELGLLQKQQPEHPQPQRIASTVERIASTVSDG